MTTGSSVRAHRIVGALIAVLAAVLAVLGSAGTASAHGSLVATDPAQDSVLPRQPTAVTLTFDDGVTLPSASLRVLDPGGERVDTGAPAHAADRADTVRVTLRDGLADGTYTVAWQVISADSHPVGGAFTFSVGAPSAVSAASAEALQGAGTDGVISFLYGTTRAVAYAAFALLTGAVAFVLICWPAGVSVRRVQRLLVTGWIALLGSTVVQMMLRGPYEQGNGILPSQDPASAQAHVPVDERIYLALALRLVLLVASGVFLVLLVGQLGQSGAEAPRRSRVRLCSAALALAVGLSATWAMTNHSSEGAQVWLAVPVTVLHLLAMAVWLGGLVTLVAGLRQGVGHAAVERFSVVALVSVTVLVLTGLYRSWREVGSWDALFDTGYGQLLLVKIGCVLLMLAAAWVSRSRLARLRGGAEGPEGGSARARLRRSVLAESVVAVVVVGVTTLLTSTPPPRTASEDVSAAAPGPAASVAPGGTLTSAIPFDTGGGTSNAQGTATATLTPATAGGYTVRLELREADGTPADVPEVHLAFTLPARDLGPLEVPLRPDGTGVWTGPARLALAGEWTVSVTVRSSDTDQTTSTGRVTIGG
ncbi:FixH family protein [Streptomyces sp. NPDC056716]|uniref:copper resistance CopC/CopD family protein n=1 Tax=unclassified Streptomyces TaxID=2593676 RepID=UPI0036ABC2C5